MIYADYSYYAGEYMGAVSEEEFPRLAVRASSFLDYFTQGRAESNANLDAVKMCCCALVDNYKVIESSRALASKRLSDALDSDADVKSETVGSWSRSLASGSESSLSALSTAENERKLLADTCREYLGNTGLLYRGRR